ncbi:hypothetical protein N0V90_000014 [Kalmusia sp. IMI 367209]|nr:hypothetical protein N0V90_000014 [Kalmusia sp. IMI 367209]
MVLKQHFFLGATAASLISAVEISPFAVRNEGVSIGELKNVSGIQIYHSYPPGRASYDKAVLFVTDIFGVPLPENQLLADSIAANDFLVIMPDLFNGDAVSVDEQEAGLNLTEWLTRHRPQEIDQILNSTITYMHNELKAKKIGGVGYCFGGKYIPHFLTELGGVDAGFIAHPSALTQMEIEAVTKPLSIAAGTLDEAFNLTAKSLAERTLLSNNVTFQSNLYSWAPHGFAVRANQSVPQQAYAKQASFLQAISWLDEWL